MFTKKNSRKLLTNLNKCQVENCPALPGRNLISTCNRRVRSPSQLDGVKFHPSKPGSCNHHLSIHLMLIIYDFLFVVITIRLHRNTWKARWWEKYLSERSLIKHTCPWGDKLIPLRTLNWQAKIFLRIMNKKECVSKTRNLKNIKNAVTQCSFMMLQTRYLTDFIGI